MYLLIRGGSQLPNQNEGLNTHLRIAHPTTKSHVLLKFSASNILSTIGTNHVVSANLKLYIETNFNNWGPGAMVDAHRISYDWQETAATWNCAVDTNLSNSAPDCEDDEWPGGYYDEYVSASLLHQNSQLGWKSLNVTADVQLVQNDYDHFGWLLRKRDSAAPGSVDYTSIQGVSFSNKPRLEITVDDQSSCTPTTVESVYPGWIQSNGASNTITIKGAGLSNIVALTRNSSSTGFTIVDSSTATFSLSSSTTETHKIQINSNCVIEPLDVFTIEASPSLEEPLVATVCPAPTGGTNFSRGWPSNAPNDKKYLCYKGQAVTRMIGNTAPFLVTDDSAFPNNGTNPTCMNENIYNCSASSSDTQTRVFVENARYNPNNPKHGSNMNRVWVFGLSGQGFSGSTTESMPFKRQPTGAQLYQFKASSSTKPALDVRYRRRLNQVLTESNRNGQVVMLSLFEHGAFRTDAVYPGTCWDPLENNLGTTCQLPRSDVDDDAGKEFYDICTTANGGVCANANLTCLGWTQKNLVDRIMNEVRNGSYKNVLIELANEPSQVSGVSLNTYLTWHKTVAKWVKAKGGYMVGVNPGPERYGNPNGAQKYLFDCTSSSCTNQYSVVNIPKVDFLSMHAGAFSLYPEGSTIEFDTCKVAQRAVSNFKKPVFLNYDGLDAYPQRNTNATVESWAAAASVSCSGLDKGIAHFEHLEDGSEQDPAPVDCAPTTETRYIDCDSYNQLGDITGLSNFCTLAGSSCPALSATQYCDSVCY